MERDFQGIFHRAFSPAFARPSDASFDMTNSAMAEVEHRVVLCISGPAFLQPPPRACHFFPEGLPELRQLTRLAETQSSFRADPWQTQTLPGRIHLLQFHFVQQ